MIGWCGLAPGKPVQCTVSHSDGSIEVLSLNHSFGEAQIAWFSAGPALNVFHQQALTACAVVSMWLDKVMRPVRPAEAGAPSRHFPWQRSSWR